jgi:adenylate kinase
METIIVTGTPCTGKTTLAKEIAKRFKFKYVDANKIVKDNDLSDGYDKERDCEIVDVKNLNRVLKAIIKEEYKVVIDSHLSHELPNDIVDLCIVTKCNLKELEKRLKERDYSKEKIRENLDSEIFDICFVEAKENNHEILIIETDMEIPWEELAKRFK